MYKSVIADTKAIYMACKKRFESRLQISSLHASAHERPQGNNPHSLNSLELHSEKMIKFSADSCSSCRNQGLNTGLSQAQARKFKFKIYSSAQPVLPSILDQDHENLKNESRQFFQ